jgi:hypothetical protein
MLDLDCKVKLAFSRRTTPRGYTESLEERVRSLEAEIREWQKANKHAGPDFSIRRSKSLENLLAPGKNLETPKPILHVLELSKNQAFESSGDFLKPISEEEVPAWIRQNIAEARCDSSPPSIRLLIVTTPENEPEDETEVLQLRNSYSQVQSLSMPLRGALQMGPNTLESFGSIFFDKPCELSDGSQTSSSYHIAYGFFGLAWAYFSQTKTCVGMLLIQDQDDRIMGDKLVQEIFDNQKLIGQPALLPLLTHKAVSATVKSWLRKHEEEVIAAQSQTGYFHQLAIERHKGFVDFSHLSKKVSGIAMNLATNKLCWQVLLDHVDFVIQETAQSDTGTTVVSVEELSQQKDLMAYASNLRRSAKLCYSKPNPGKRKPIFSFKVSSI